MYAYCFERSQGQINRALPMRLNRRGIGTLLVITIGGTLFLLIPRSRSNPDALEIASLIAIGLLIASESAIFIASRTWRAAGREHTPQEHHGKNLLLALLWMGAGLVCTNVAIILFALWLSGKPLLFGMLSILALCGAAPSLLAGWRHSRLVAISRVRKILREGKGE